MVELRIEGVNVQEFIIGRTCSLMNFGTVSHDHDSSYESYLKANPNFERVTRTFYLRC